VASARIRPVKSKRAKFANELSPRNALSHCARAGVYQS
jgi:hypothetical protein